MRFVFSMKDAQSDILEFGFQFGSYRWNTFPGLTQSLLTTPILNVKLIELTTLLLLSMLKSCRVF